MPPEETQQHTMREDAPVRRRRYPPSYSIHTMIRRQERAGRSRHSVNSGTVPTTFVSSVLRLSIPDMTYNVFGGTFKPYSTSI